MYNIYKSKNEEKFKQLENLIRKYPRHYTKILNSGQQTDLRKWIDDVLPDLKDDVYSLQTKCYWILNNIVDFPLCENCKKKLFGLNVLSLFKGYPKSLACSIECSRKISQKKRENFNLEHYGVKNPFQRQDVKTNIHEYFEKTYGNKCPANNANIRDDIKKQNLKKFGVEYYSQTDEYKEKVVQTNLKKFGVTNPMKSENIKLDLKKHMKTKYNASSYLASDDWLSKKDIVLKDKYGENYNQVMFGNHGNEGQSRRAFTKYISNNDYVKPLFNEQEYVDGIKNNKNYFKFQCKKCGNEFYSSWDNGQTTKKCPDCQITSAKTSKKEHEVYAFVSGLLKNTIVKHNDRSLLKDLELDIYIPEKKLAIEFDGLYWHCSDVQTNHRYHLQKTELCEKQGIQLIHIFENEWIYKQDIVKSRLKNLLGIYDKTIYARKCEVREIDSKTSKDFQEQNHIQGAINSSINLGLYFENELISLMTFGKSRFNKKYEWELLRFCNKLNYHIPGAAGKLLKYFERNYHPKSIISYADRRWSQGKLYKALNFQLDHSSAPNYWYFKSYTQENLESRVKYQKHKLKNILENFQPNLSETQNMKNNGYHMIYDCGNHVFTKIL